MSDPIVSAIIGFVGAILGAALVGYATIAAARITQGRGRGAGKSKGQKPLPRVLVIIAALLGAVAFFSLGVFFTQRLLDGNVSGPVEIVPWDDLLARSKGQEDFTGEAWFCQAQTYLGSTVCHFGAEPPKPGCYLLFNKERTAGIDVEDAASKLGAEFLPSVDGKSITSSSGYGCGVPESNDYWLLWGID